MAFGYWDKAWSNLSVLALMVLMRGITIPLLWRYERPSCSLKLQLISYFLARKCPCGFIFIIVIGLILVITYLYRLKF